jgi:monoamine oxidase
MARTPLMRSLMQFVADYEAAHRRNVPVEAILEELGRADERRRQIGITRRQFLAGAAAGAATLMLPSPVRGAGAPRITIVGGGISGLCAALTLADRGVFSTVYEASGRLGGRMHSLTNYWHQGQVTEWCGELIDTDNTTIHQLAARYNLNLTDLIGSQPAGSQDTFYFFGEYYSRAEANEDFTEVYEALSDQLNDAASVSYNSGTPRGIALDHLSLYDWIERYVPGGHESPMGALLEIAYATEYGAETVDQSSINLITLMGYQPPRYPQNPNFEMYGSSDERYHIVGGNERLPLAIANDLTSRGIPVLRDKRMVAISLRGDGTYAVTFVTDGGRRTFEVVADHVILTLPFAVLRNPEQVDYSRAGFDALKRHTIQALGRGNNGKIQTQFNRRLWNQTGPWPGISDGYTFSDNGYQVTWDTTRGQPLPRGILVDYTAGRVSQAQRARRPYATITDPNVQFDVNAFLGQIDQVFPGLRGLWNGLAAESRPFLDPNLNLSYAYWRVGQLSTIAGYEGVAQGNCHFAGEHTSINFQGFMEGGAEEGIRAANEVLTALGIPP